MSAFQATVIGGTAILLWGALALLTVWTGAVPPFLLVGLTFSLAFGVMGGKWLIFRENPLQYLPGQKRVWLLGIAGLFGYHAFYFVALRHWKCSGSPGQGM